MPERSAGADLWHAIESLVTASRWWAPVSTVLFAVSGTVLFTVGQDLENRADVLWVSAGVLVTGFAGMIQLLRERGAQAALDGASQGAQQFRIAMKDALQPVAELIADMPGKTPRERERAVEGVARQAVSALTLLLKDVDRLRAVVYQLDEDGMSHIAYNGRGNKPNAFIRSTDRGRLACQMVEDGGNHFEPDIRKASSEAYRGSGNGYETYISVAICTGDTGYGMLTVDAPHANDLVDTDRQIVSLVADLLAIAYAVADAK